MPSSVMSGAWPGKIPSSPSRPGTTTSTTFSRMIWRSGVTTINSMESGSIFLLGRARLHRFSLLENFVDGAHHVERLLRNFIVLAFDDFLEAAHGVFDLDVFAFEAGELRGDEHGLRKEFFDAASARNGALVFVGKFFDTENRDNVLQILVTLKNGLHRAGDGVMLLADHAWIENSREAGQRIDRRINAAFDDLAAEVGSGIQVREGGSRSGVGVIVGRHVDGLH